MSRCECDWTHHRGEPCSNPLDAAGVVTSPALCTPCLFVCEREREEAAQWKEMLNG